MKKIVILLLVLLMSACSAVKPSETLPGGGFDLLCGAGRLAALTCPRHVIHHRSGSNPVLPLSKTKNSRKAVFCFTEAVGFDLLCGVGRLAALTCPRHVIHYRSGSNPVLPLSKAKAPGWVLLLLAEAVGFEPTSP